MMDLYPDKDKSIEASKGVVWKHVFVDCGRVHKDVDCVRADLSDIV
jgi:hypothetical protein